MRLIVPFLALSLLALAGCGSQPVSNEFRGDAASGTAVPDVSIDAANARVPKIIEGDVRELFLPQGQDFYEYRVSIGDLINVTVFAAKELDRKVRVRGDGNITLPLIGVVKAEGKTIEELRDEITMLLERDYLNDPQVTLFVDEYTEQKVVVAGAVSKSGVYPLKGKATLMFAIAESGGRNRVGSESNVLLFRPQSNGDFKVYQVDIGAIRKGQIPDPQIRGNDRIYVQDSPVRVAAFQFIPIFRVFYDIGVLGVQNPF
jgi:polysaccharide export outer membrane protein